MIFVFTGTRQGMTPEQQGSMVAYMSWMGGSLGFFHGGAPGADQRFHEHIVNLLGLQLPEAWMRIYPSAGSFDRYWEDDVTRFPDRIAVMPTEAPLVRNRRMLTDAKRLDGQVRLLAAPVSAG